MSTLPPESLRAILPALEELPVFPLPHTVLFPGALLPLHIFEPRYRAMIRDCLATHKVLAIALIRESGERTPNGHPSIEPVAGVGTIIDHAALADGRFNVLVQGRARVRLAELPFVPPYRRAKASVLAAEVRDPPACDVTALLASATAFAADIRARDPEFDFRIPAHAPPAAIADLAAHHLIVDSDERQSILETLDVCTRVRRTAEALALQHAALSRASDRRVVN